MFSMVQRFPRQIQRCLHYSSQSSSIHYVQGQSPNPGVREYFYFINHQGMLYLDDARIKNFTSCIKDEKFLKFFINQLRPNKTNRYNIEFPYLSLCGKEKNYVRCDDLPIVFTKFLLAKPYDVLTYNHCGIKLAVPFQPSKLYMSINGRIYHPGPKQLHGIGLVSSKLAIEFSHGFQFDEHDVPTHFKHQGEVHKLDLSMGDVLQNFNN